MVMQEFRTVPFIELNASRRQRDEYSLIFFQEYPLRVGQISLRESAPDCDLFALRWSGLILESDPILLLEA